MPCAKSNTMGGERMNIVVMCKDCGYETNVADWGKHNTCACRSGEEE